MGNSRFGFSHVMPNVWFYKLTDIGRFRRPRRRVLQGRNSNREESGTRSYDSGRNERVGDFPVNDRGSTEGAKHKTKMLKTEPKRKSTLRGKQSKRGSSTLTGSTISTGCICRARVDSRRKSSDREEHSNSKSSHREEPVSYCSRQQSVSVQKEKDCSTQFMERLDRSQLAPDLESQSGNWKQPSKHFLQYDCNVNNTAGLPRPAIEYKGFIQRDQLLQPPVRIVKKMAEVVPDPFVVDTSIACSSSCSFGLSSPSCTEDKALSSNEEDSQEEDSIFDMKNLVKNHMEQKQRLFMEESMPPSITRPRYAELESGIKGHKQKQNSDKMSVQSAGKEQEQHSASVTKISSTNAVLDRLSAKSWPQLSVKIDKNNARSSSGKPSTTDCKEKSIAKERRTNSQRPSPLKGTKCNQKVDSQKGSKQEDKRNIIYSDRNSSNCGDSGESSSVCDSFAVVKSSYNPHKDFRKSMVEMIVENNIHYSRDLQQLLQCYLSLNSDEYHDVIVKAFEQVKSDFRKICS